MNHIVIDKIVSSCINGSNPFEMMGFDRPIHRGQGALRPFDQRFYFPPCFQQGMAPKSRDGVVVEEGEPAVGGNPPNKDALSNGSWFQVGGIGSLTLKETTKNHCKL